MCIRTRKRHAQSALTAVLLACMSLPLGAARADGPTVHDRVVVARGDGYPTPQTEQPVWEVDLAAAQDWAIAVFHQGYDVGKRVAYSVGWYDPNLPGWNWDPNTYEDRVPLPEGTDDTWDPSIAADPNTGDFVAVAMGNGRPGEVLVSTLDPNYAEPRPGTWRPLRPGDDDYGADKPWIITGQQTPHGREFYVVWCMDHSDAGEPDGFGYARTVDGGVNWTDVSDMAITVDGERVTGGWCAQHTTNMADPSAPIYVAYRHGSEFRFLKGVDIQDPNDPNEPADLNNPRVTFHHLGTRVFPHFGPLGGGTSMFYL